MYNSTIRVTPWFSTVVATQWGRQISDSIYPPWSDDQKQVSFPSTEHDCARFADLSCWIFIGFGHWKPYLVDQLTPAPEVIYLLLLGRFSEQLVLFFRTLYVSTDPEHDSIGVGKTGCCCSESLFDKVTSVLSRLCKANWFWLYWLFTCTNHREFIMALLSNVHLLSRGLVEIERHI